MNSKSNEMDSNLNEMYENDDDVTFVPGTPMREHLIAWHKRAMNRLPSFNGYELHVVTPETLAEWCSYDENEADIRVLEADNGADTLYAGDVYTENWCGKFTSTMFPFPVKTVWVKFIAQHAEDTLLTYPIIEIPAFVEITAFENDNDVNNHPTARVYVDGDVWLCANEL